MERGIVFAAARLAVLIVATLYLGGCGNVLAEGETNVIRIGFIASPSHGIAHQQRKAIELAFGEANRRGALRPMRIVLENGASELDLAVVAAQRSTEEGLMGNQIAFLNLSLQERELALQPMRSLECPASATPCEAALAERKTAFIERFHAATGQFPVAEAYVAYAESESLILASRRLLAERQLSFPALRRALLFGQFATLIGNLRYAVPPEMIDETIRQNALAINP